MNRILRRFLPLFALLPACLSAVAAQAASAPNAAPLSWTATDIASAPDGSARVLWTRSDGAEGLWVMSPQDKAVSMGSVYGPYAESAGTWSAKAMRTASDGDSRILWVRSDGAAGVWTVDPNGNPVAIGPTFGPFTYGTGVWHASDIAVAPDGTSRLLWKRDDGAERVWTVDAANMESDLGALYGPFSDSGGTWRANHISVDADGSSRVLWNRSDGAMVMWSLDSSGKQRTAGTVYGPFAGWTATGIATSTDTTARILWTKTDGTFGLWTMNDLDSEVTVGPSYGPFAGWTATRIDLNTNEDARVLFSRSDRAMGLWTFGSNDTDLVIGSVYGPY